jgi:hypothetical protein
MARKNPLDMGVYHADGSITYDDDETPKRGRGRPRKPQDWPRIDVVIDFYLNCGLSDQPPELEKIFIERMREWCQREGRQKPGYSTLEKRIHKRANQPK